MTTTNPTTFETVSVPARVRRHLAWLFVGIAVIATALLVTFTISDGNSDADVTPHGQLIEQGSVRAIEHRDSTAPAAADSLLDRSITAIDWSAR